MLDTAYEGAQEEAPLPVVPPRDPGAERVPTTLHLTRRLIDELELAGELEELSRSEMGVHCIEWALEQHWRERKRLRPTDPAVELAALRAKKGKKAPPKRNR